VLLEPKNGIGVKTGTITNQRQPSCTLLERRGTCQGLLADGMLLKPVPWREPSVAAARKVLQVLVDVF